MLSLIRVKNYAVIDEIEVEFGSGLNVMTGETGAGKSILVDALGLALGDRSDASAVRHGAERAEISVSFDVPDGHDALRWLAERGLDDETACTLRRLVGSDGRSRAFINGQPVNLQDLKALGGLLVDIQGQHAHQSMLDTGNQRALLDAHDELAPLAKTVAERFAAWHTLVEQLENRRSTSAQRQSEIELGRFQLAELEALALAEGEPERLRAERDRLANTDRLLSGATAALDALAENEAASAYAAVVLARRELDKLAGVDPELRGPAAVLASIEIELREVETALQHYRDRVEADPARLAWLDDRLARVRSLARRHAASEDDLPRVLPALRERLAVLDGSGESLEALEKRTADARAQFLAAARRLSGLRAEHAATLSGSVTSLLVELGMPHGEFRVELEEKPLERADATGLERIEFQVKLNPGLPFGSLAKVASGGELSRVSLAVEVARSGASPVTAFVFDEVDAGISGRVADIVGRKLRQLSSTRQVLCVTHLPQVASHGAAHYRVEKQTDGKVSRTDVRSLTSKERVEELSRMLGGVEVTARTRAHAAEMIDRAGR
ncbi:MAG TPA: DNA repair protein RecN [Gammaproteobacteria bacterium]|nr:DNA repair protein RecN [Gammaproteobacteria bacterium]